MTFRPVCEFVERRADRLIIGVHLRGGEVGPEALFALRLRRRWRGPVLTVQAPVLERVNTVGRRSWTALRFSVPVDQLPNAALRLEIARTGTAGWTVIGTTPGLLACSRPEPIGTRRVQVLPGAGRSATWLRLSSWSRPAQMGWTVRNATRELAFVLHRRRFTWVRPVRLLTRPLVPRGPVWLVGERPETARDNGFAFFAHLRRERPQEPIYYVIAKDSPMAGDVAALGHVVWHSSWRHRLLMLHASVIANAYSIKHMLPSRWRPGAYMNQCAWRVGARRVYLKHGVHVSPDAVKRGNGGYDLIATVGAQEADALARTSGYSTAQLRETGLARYDNLVPERPSRTVLFMPTWRRYLVPRLFGGNDTALVGYQGSTYQRFVHGLLASDELASMLKRHDLTMKVVPHYNLAGLLHPDQLGSDRITILDGTTADIPHLLRSCALLLTDYSSVQFDVAYVGAPVVYAQFDREEYEAGHGGTSWFDAERDGFGPVVTTLSQTIQALEDYAAGGFVREAHYDAQVRRIFSHDDRQNCARIATAVDDLVATAPSTVRTSHSMGRYTP